jgi:hypothetical protein
MPSFEFEMKKNEKEDCSICLRKLKKKELCMHLNCSHIFHSKCILDWFEINIECPVCRDTDSCNECSSGSESESESESE